MPAMNSTERIYLRMERRGFPCDIAGINVLEQSPEGPLPFEQVRALFDQRAHRSPLLTLMLAPAPLGIGEDRWTQAATLDIDAHVHHWQVPAPGDTDALLATVIELTKEPLDRSRPLWEVWYLTGMARGAAALVLRTHHAAIDGVGIMQLHRVLFDTEPTPVDVREESQPVEGRRYPSLLRRALFEVPNRVASQVATTGRIVKTVGTAAPQVFAIPARAVRKAAPDLASRLGLELPGTEHSPELPGYIPSLTHHPPVTMFNKHVDNPRKSMAVTSVPLTEVKRVRRAFPGVTVNDILFALVTGTMREYLAANDDLPEGPLRATCPASIRVPGEEAGPGNHITTIWIDLPVHLTDPAERLLAVSANATAAKASLPEAQASWEALSDVGDLLLPGVVSAVMAFAGTRAFGAVPPTQNLTVSTVIGSAEPLYLATRRFTRMYVRTIVCPPIHLFFQALTYAGSIDFSITTVHELCPDPKPLADGLRAELDRLVAVAQPAKSAPRSRKAAHQP